MAEVIPSNRFFVLVLCRVIYNALKVCAVDWNVYLPTPQPNDQVEFMSCYTHVVFKTRDTLSNEKQTGVIKTTFDYTIYPMTCEREIQVINLEDTIPYDKIFTRLVYFRTGVALKVGLDSFSLVKPEHFGNNYFVSTGKEFSNAQFYAVLINMYRDKRIRISVETERILGLHEYRVVGSPTNSKTAFEIPVNGSVTIASGVKPLSGMRLASVDIFGVLAGCTIVNPQNVPMKEVVHLVEMFPPASYFSDEYIVPYFERVNAQNYIQVVSTNTGSVYGRRIELSTFGKTSTFTLSDRKRQVTYLQQKVERITSKGNIMVMQILFETRSKGSAHENVPTAMTLIPPTTKWVQSVFVMPLKVKGQKNDVTHYADVIIKTFYIKELKVMEVATKRVVSFIPVPIKTSEYSHGMLTLSPSQTYWIFHKNQTFQVIQYGLLGNRKMVYASPASMWFEGDMGWVKPELTPLITKPPELTTRPNSAPGVTPKIPTSIVDHYIGVVIVSLFLVVLVAGSVFYVFVYRKMRRKSQADSENENEETKDGDDVTNVDETDIYDDNSEDSYVSEMENDLTKPTQSGSTIVEYESSVDLEY